MLIRRNRGWELRESAATPESVFSRRRELLKAMGLGSMLMPGLVARSAPQWRRSAQDPSAGLYPVKRNPRYTLDRPDHRPEIFRELQQFLRIRLGEDDRRRGAGAEDPAVDGQDRRHGRKADRHRHRRSVEEDAARRTALPPPLRRGVVDGGAVERLSDGGAGCHGEAAGFGEICAHGDLRRRGESARAKAVLVSLALYRGRHDGRGQ